MLVGVTTVSLPSIVAWAPDGFELIPRGSVLPFMTVAQPEIAAASNILVTPYVILNTKVDFIRVSMCALAAHI